MADNPYQVKLSRDNAALIMIDHLSGFLPAIGTISPELYQKNVTAVAKIGKIFKLPTVILGDEGGFRGNFLPQIRDFLGDARFVERHTPSAWHVQEFRDTLKEYRRPKIVLAGISIDNCVSTTSLDLLRNGYEVYVVVDASGTTTAQVETAAMMRLTQAGAVMTGWVSLASEIMEDWNTPEGPLVGALYRDYSPWGGE